MVQPREDAMMLVGCVEGSSVASVRVLGTDGTELPFGSVGEIAIRSPGVMRDYHRQSVETSRSLDEEDTF